MPNGSDLPGPGTIIGQWPDADATYASVSSRAEHGPLAYLTMLATYPRYRRSAWQAIFVRDELAAALRRALGGEPGVQEVMGTWPQCGRVALRLEDTGTSQGPGRVWLSMKILAPDELSTVGHGSGLFRRADLASLLASCVA